MKEKDLENRLAPEAIKETSKPVVPSPHGMGTDGDLAKDYQLQRALELLRSLDMIKEQGLNLK
jgi:hypothetical protein